MTTESCWQYYGGIGARNTPPEVLADMTTVARWQKGRRRVLRSGGARGADSAFELGAGYLSEIWVPWRRFPFADAEDADEHYVLLRAGPWKTELEKEAERLHPAWRNLSTGGRALMTRNMAQLYGAGPGEPISEYMIGYAQCDSQGNWIGGTGQAFRAAREARVPVINFWTSAGPLKATNVIEQVLAIEARPKLKAAVSSADPTYCK